MYNAAKRGRILATLAEHPELSSVGSVESSDDSDLVAIRACAVVEGHRTQLLVGLDWQFPLSLPHVVLRPSNALGFIPHVFEGSICYSEMEGILLDTDNPAHIVFEAVDRSLDILRRGVRGDNRMDFMDEFAVYWAKVSRMALDSFLDVDDQLREVTAYWSKNQGYVSITDRNSRVESYFDGLQKPRVVGTRRTALYLPLQAGAFAQPPQPGHPWSVEQARAAVASNITKRDFRKFRKLGSKCKREELAVLSLPRPSGGRTLVGLLYQDVSGGHPLLGGNAQDPPLAVRIDRLDPEYLLPRSGGNVDLGGKRVMLAGCGAVGGYAALAFARVGVGKLTLIDPDRMKRENIFRHVLGRSALGKPKVSGLLREIQQKYPYVTVDIHELDLVKAIVEGTVRIKDYDLVMCALGNPTIERHLNRYVHDTEGAITVFAWLEPYGIGGHALLTRPGRPGCYECLFTPPHRGGIELVNRAALTAPGQRFGKDDLGCGNLYVPYSALDAERTAVMALALAVDGLLGREEGSPLLSWKGPETNLCAAGFRTSRRYELTPDQLDTRRYEYVARSCPVCGIHENENSSL